MSYYDKNDFDDLFFRSFDLYEPETIYTIADYKKQYEALKADFAIRGMLPPESCFWNIDDILVSKFK
jgi:hypothetical protein